MDLTCPSCSSVHLTRRRVYRASSLAVFLGHFLLVPSILVLVLGSMGVVRPQVARDSLEDAQHAAQRASAELEAVGVPAELAADVSAQRPPAESDLAALTPDQRHSVLAAQVRVADSSTRSAMTRFTSGSGFKLLLAAALACGVAGLFLVRKQGVAHCTTCGSQSPLV